MWKFALVAVWALGKRASRQGIMGSPAAGACFGMSPFRIGHQGSSLFFCFVSVIHLVAEFFQRRPTRVFNWFGAGALLDVQVLAAMRAKTLAVLSTNCFQGNGKQDLLPQYILQKQAFPLIVTDLCFRGSYSSLFLAGIRPLGTIKQIELSRDSLDDRLQTSRTKQLDSSIEITLHSYVFDYVTLTVMLFNQLRLSLSVQRLHLPEIRTEVDRIRGEVLREIDRMEFQFMKFDKHGKPPRPHPHTAKAAEARSECKFFWEQSLRIKARRWGVKEQRRWVVGLLAHYQTVGTVTVRSCSSGGRPSRYAVVRRIRPRH